MGDELLVDALALFALEERAEDPLELALRAVVARGGEALPDPLGGRGLAERQLA